MRAIKGIYATGEYILRLRAPSFATCMHKGKEGLGPWPLIHVGPMRNNTRKSPSGPDMPRTENKSSGRGLRESPDPTRAEMVGKIGRWGKGQRICFLVYGNWMRQRACMRLRCVWKLRIWNILFG